MDKFDAVIIGAGLAGLGAAYVLTGRGLDLVVLERGDYPGAKNVTGGRIYINPIRQLFPDLFESAPLERCITHEGITLLAKDRSVALGYSGRELKGPSPQSYSILRAKFDRWLAEQVEKKGGIILSKTKVEEIIKENGKIAGVIAGGDELRSNVVIACDGALSIMAEKAGLHPPYDSRNFAIGLKEVISLEAATINDRFNLDGSEGAARLYVGDVSQGKFGAGFIYTNKESISIGIVVILEEESPIQIAELLDAFKERPEIAPLIKGGNPEEYSAHVIPEGGFKAVGNLYGDGILVAGDAAGLALNMGFTVRGMEYALASGYFAAQAVLKAKAMGEFNAPTLRVYKDLLEDSFVLKDFRNFQEAPTVLGRTRFLRHYPEWLGNILKEIYQVPEGPKGKLFSTVRKHFNAAELWATLKDLKELRKI